MAFLLNNGVLETGANVTLGVADTNGKFQPLAFTGTEASNSGEPESAETFYSWNSTLPSPESGGTMDFYKCAEVGMTVVEMPDPVLAEAFNGTLVNNFTQLGSAPEYSTIAGRQGMLCKYTHRLSLYVDNLPSGNAPRTLSAWIYCNEGSLSGEWSMFCGYGGSSSINMFYLTAYLGDFLCYTHYPYKPWSAISDSTWVHLVATYDGTQTVGYINGTQVGTLSQTLETINTAENPLCIGWMATDDREFSTNAYISDLRIYDVALSAEQVAELYQPTPSSLLPANTWSGYKAYLVEDTENDKVYYDFETDLTTDTLTWGKAFTPKVDSIYNADATVKTEVIIEPAAVWKELSDRVQGGRVELGEIIEVPNTALTDVGLAEGVIQFEVVAIDNADLVDTTKKHSITLFAKKVLFAKQWASASHNKWSNSQLRTYLQSTFLDCLDAGFVPFIAPVNRTHCLSYGGGEETIRDTVFLPSYTEIGFGQNEGISEGTQWDIMTSDESRKRDMNGQSYYWLSSAQTATSYYVWVVRSAGSLYDGTSFDTRGVCPALVFA